MGLGIKLLNILGGQKKKMKEKKSESFSFFRKSGTRYSFTSDKKKQQQQESNNVQIQRLSWSSFPVIKASAPEEPEKSRTDLPSRLSRSSENLKKQAKTLHGLSKSKSSSFFKSSSSTMKNIFGGNSSSSSVSSSNSSVSSSPKIRQSWSSGVTNILERVGVGDIDDTNLIKDTESNPYDFQANGNIAQSRNSNNKEAFKPKVITSYSRNYCPIPSLMDGENEGEIMCTPKIICAHKKTPDAKRKSRRQIIQELENIKELGMLPEEIEPIVINVKEKENLSPHYENFSYSIDNFNLNSLKGYKTTEESPNLSVKQVNTTKEVTKNNLDLPLMLSKQDATLSHSVADGSHGDSFNDKSCSSSSLSDSNSSSSTINCSSSDASSECTESVIANESICSKTNISTSDNSLVLNASTDIEYSSEKYTTPNHFENSSLTSILVEDSECDDDSETMTNDGDNSSTFETRLEDDLESWNDRRNSKGQHLETGIASDEEETVQLRRKSRPNLHIDIDKARSQKTFSNDRLRRIADDSSDSARSSRSSPRTPRSPAIDIDILFKQRQKKIEESSKDNLTQVKDLTQRLRLSTKSSPSHVKWVNGIKNKSDARHLAEIMSPVVLENSEGVFDLQETEGCLTEEQRTKNITKALVWIKDELTQMKEQDQSIAKQLVQLQLEMQRLRLHRSCTQHEALLEEVTCEEEEQKAFMTSTDLIDFPNNLRECAYLSLRDFGVTRMNLANRRFTLR